MGYFILIAFILSQSNSFKKIIQKDEFEKKDLIILSIIFGGFGILGTYIGVEINGSIANTRIIGIMAGGILCGPFVGIISGIIAGVHRAFIHVGDVTAFPCVITTIICGVVSAGFYKKANKKNRWVYGLIGGIIIESLEMILILALSKPFDVALSIVKDIYIPMGFANAIGISLFILLIENIFDEKEQIAAKQAKISLEIANKTLPYFRNMDGDSFDEICKIIKNYINADAVAITDKKYVLAHVGTGSDHHTKGSKILTTATEKVIEDGSILVLQNSNEINCSVKECPLKSAIVVPLKEGEKIKGTLKIYYIKEDAVSFKDKNLAIGLSQIISTQLEISRVGKLKEMATKAEIKALQTQINPHFLFNALNTIASFVRINPSKARELIINLSTFLRYNLEMGNTFVDIHKELEQVRAYIEVEKARFGNKLNVVYNIEEDIDIKIPSLIIQPLVENSVKHGILPGGKSGTVSINIKKVEEKNVEIIIEDDGVGISKEIIKGIYEGTIKENKIGMSNVNNRLKFIYGSGLKIQRLDKGTRISFIIKYLKG